MNNKVLVNIFIPEIDSEYDLFVPVNDLIWKISKLVVKSISDISGVPLNPKDNYIFINKKNNRVYNSNEILIDTDIRNGTEIILFKL